MWPLKCIEHVVLVQQRDCDPEFFPGEPLEPVDCKKVFFFPLSIALRYRNVLHLTQPLKLDKQSTTYYVIVSMSR